MKIAILSDSGTGMNQQEAKELGIYYLPLQILNGQTQYLDGVNIELRQIYDLLHTQAQLSTSMPALAWIEDMLDQIKADGYDWVLCIPITSGLSSTAAMISASASEKGLYLKVIDCYSTCYIQRYLVECAKHLADQGFTCEEICDRLQHSIASSNTLIIPDDLGALKRGGRLTPMAAALGGLLKIKPILQLNEVCAGKIDVLDKVRTMSKAQQKAIAIFQEAALNEDYVVSCLHTDAQGEGEELLVKLKDALPNCQFYFGLIGAVISVHTGIGCLGIQYIRRVEGC